VRIARCPAQANGPIAGAAFPPRRTPPTAASRLHAATTGAGLAAAIWAPLVTIGAVGYQAVYYPLLQCWLQRPVESFSRGDASFRCELTGEEV